MPSKKLKKYNYVFGPVPSRRLGRSLGVDLVPFKTCSYDCIYCQLGETTNKIVEIKDTVPLDVVIEQIKAKLEFKPDYITLSGSGEPTLCAQISELISDIKSFTDVPVAVLTNGSLLWQPQVRKSLLMADLVIPSLDAGSSEIFEYINRPQKSITFDNMLRGLIDFRKEFKGQLWLEILLLAGVNTTEVQVAKLREAVLAISPDRVQINTVTRPPAQEFAQRVPQGQLEEIAKRIYGKAEVIADYRHVHDQSDFTVLCDDVLTLLKRRPCSIEDISAGLGIHKNEVIKYIEELSSKGEIESKRQNQKTYYSASNETE